MSYHWDYLNPKAYDNRVGRYNFKKVFEFLKEYSEGYRQNILDIAGGSGRFSLPLVNSSGHITVVDLNESAIMLLKERNPSIESINGDFMQQAFEKEFSLAMCFEAIGYFPDMEAFLKKIYGHLSPDGRFIFNYTNPNSWRFFLRKLRHWKNGPTAYNDVAIDQLKMMLQSTGFEIKEVEGMYWLPLPLTSNSVWVDAFVWIEQKLGLGRWHNQSPWLIICAQKK